MIILKYQFESEVDLSPSVVLSLSDDRPENGASTILQNSVPLPFLCGENGICLKLTPTRYESGFAWFPILGLAKRDFTL